MDPETQQLKPQLEGKRGAVVIATYEDKPRDDYYHEAEKLASYLGWMGDFGKVEIMCEARLGPSDAIQNRPELLDRAEELGRNLLT